MAERVPPPVDETHILDPNVNNFDSQSSKTEADPNCFCRPAATYVVQVPKDQIYRVPPPENAAIAERRRHETPGAKKENKTRKLRPCASRCCCAILLITTLLLALGLAATLLSTYFHPNDPVFHVERLHVINAADSPRTNLTRDYVYKLTLRSDNPNAKVDMSYERGGAVSLWFKQQEIAAGRFPAFYHAHGSSTAFETVLLGSDVSNRDRRLPKDIEKIMVINGVKKAHVTLTLKMSNLSARTEVWTWNTGSVELDVACDITVDSLMAKDSDRILSQECRTT